MVAYSTTFAERECRCWLSRLRRHRLRSVMSARGRVIVITGAMATGKSTVADLLAIRLPKSVHIHGDMFRRMVVSGRADMTPNPSPDAIAQLNLRYDLAAMAADRCAEDGFDAIVQDLILGKDLADFVKRIASPERYLVVLSPTCPPWSGARRCVRRPRTFVCRQEPSMRCCVARQPRSATGSTAVLKPPRRRWTTSSPICNEQRSRTEPAQQWSAPAHCHRTDRQAWLPGTERTLDTGLGPRYCSEGDRDSRPNRDHIP